MAVDERLFRNVDAEDTDCVVFGGCTSSRRKQAQGTRHETSAELTKPRHRPGQLG
jgi:hypothetical protein